MALDNTFSARNRASTERIRALAARLSDDDLRRRVGEHWTVAIALAHIAFWDRRVMFALDMTERDSAVFDPDIKIAVNDLSLPLWAAIPPREAARIAIDEAEKLDARIEAFPPSLLEQIHAYNPRWVFRDLHRGEHLDEVDAALQSLPALGLRAVGDFHVELTPQPAENSVGRLIIRKRFTGDLDATSAGEMLSVRTAVEVSAGYVAMEIVTGTLRGKAGAFALQHTGTMARGAATLRVSVVPDSGTGQLEGISGEMKIVIEDGRHAYIFDYNLPS